MPLTAAAPSFRRTARFASVFALAVLATGLTAADLPLPASADNLAPWSIPAKDQGKTKWDPTAGKAGKGAFIVVDADEADGSYLNGPKMPVTSGTPYEFRFLARRMSGDGIAVYLVGWKRDGTRVELNQEPGGMTAVNNPDWVHYRALFVPPEGIDKVTVYVHSFNASKVTAVFESFSFREMAPDEFKPKWKAQYKIEPDEKDRLTEADVAGPDGLVYPNWKSVGVRGGIPSFPVQVKLALQDGDDAADAIEEAAQKLEGEGAILLPEGTFRLSRRIFIRKNGVALRGAGMDKTRLVFDWTVPKGQLQFFRLQDGAVLGRRSTVEIDANPEGLTNVALRAGGKTIASTSYYAAHWGLTFSIRLQGDGLLAKLGAGEKILEGEALYRDGSSAKARLRVTLVDADAGDDFGSQQAAITFLGVFRGPDLKTLPLRADAARGSRRLVLGEGHGLAAGDKIRLEAPATKKWNELVQNAAPWGWYRENMYEVKAADATTVTISEPLRIDFPVEDGAYVQPMRVVERCGVEDLTLEQTRNIWTSGVVFNAAFDAWLRGVQVIKAGRNPFYMPLVKYGEVRDCRFRDAWWKGGGGTAYVGFERSYDCLLTGVEASELRHAPNLNWAAAGCVFRDSVFDGMDGQWHCGWAHENLFENLTIRSDTKGGGYGFGLYSTAPDDAAHGPIGPRNVVWNCDVSSPKDGLVLSGMNEGWIVAWNRFRVGKGRAVGGKTHSFDHRFVGNRFEIDSPVGPAFYLATPDCTGWELRDNQFVGWAKDRWIGGTVHAAVEEGNAEVEKGADRPRPPVPSIFLWQKGR